MRDDNIGCKKGLKSFSGKLRVRLLSSSKIYMYAHAVSLLQKFFYIFSLSLKIVVRRFDADLHAL